MIFLCFDLSLSELLQLASDAGEPVSRVSSFGGSLAGRQREARGRQASWFGR